VLEQWFPNQGDARSIPVRNLWSNLKHQQSGIESTFE